MDIHVNKTHKAPLSGRKADKKKAKSKHEQVLTDRQRNPKAFAINSAVKAQKRFNRAQDLQTKKHHQPLVDRNPLEPPPIIVAIVGPPETGKTTIFRSLIKHYTSQRVSKIEGPVTVVASKKCRYTFLECNNDINCMLDIAKIVDILILVVNAKHGFNMSHMEFLGICTAVGLPKVLCVMTHIDEVKNKQQLKAIKKRTKKKLWEETYNGAKLFFLSKFVAGQYLKNEVQNLTRYIASQKLRPHPFKTTHPYLVIDRVEDVTDMEQLKKNQKIDRNICLYGYLRGTFLKNRSDIHIMGCGDYTVKNVTFLTDPCPLPNKDKKKGINQKHHLIYAPMSGTGGIIFDEDDTYIDLKGSNHLLKKPEQLDNSEQRKIISSVALKNDSSEEDSEGESEDESGGEKEDFEDDEISEEDVGMESDDERDIEFEEDDSDSEEENENPSGEKIANTDIFKLPEKKSDSPNNFEEEFSGPPLKKPKIDLSSIENCFVTGDWEGEDAKTLLEQDEKESSSEDENDDESEGEETDGKSEDEGSNSEEDELKVKERLDKKKTKHSQLFDDKSDYYEDQKKELDLQAQMNKSEFENYNDRQRVMYEGFRPGMYVRISLEKMYSEFIMNLDNSYPIIVGGLLKGESELGFVRAKVKLNKFYPRILKNNDPLIISIGWRRFQTKAVYSCEDHNGRHRAIKYLQKHMTQNCTFYGPIMPLGTGVVAIQDIEYTSEEMRIAATGSVQAQGRSTSIVKKIKLTGYPLKIEHKTAFIEGMFNSDLEVAKFEGAVIQTASGIRGTIKRGIREIKGIKKSSSGSFRATFEDLIKMSDIVILKSWIDYPLTKYYLTIPNLLLPKGNKEVILKMKTCGQLKYERKIAIKQNPDSLYTPIERKPKVFPQVKISKELQAKLPYKYKPVIKHKEKNEPTFVMQTPEEIKRANLMDVVKALAKSKRRDEILVQRTRVKAHKKMKAKDVERFKQQRKKYFQNSKRK